MAAQPTFHPTPILTTSTQTEAPPAGGLGALGVDGSLLLVQTVNFFLLLAILTWLLYRPILRLLADRRRLIVEGLAAAESQTKAAAAYQETRQKLLADAKNAAAQLLTEARAELKAERTSLQATLKADRERHRAELAQDRQAMARRLETDVRRSIAVLVATAVTKLFTDLAQDPKSWQPELERMMKEMEP